MVLECDEEALKQLQELMGDDFNQLVDTYLKHSQAHLDSIKAGLEDKDPRKIRDAAHPLKSSSGNMGFPLLSSLAAKCEKKADYWISSNKSTHAELLVLHEGIEEQRQKACEKLTFLKKG